MSGIAPSRPGRVGELVPIPLPPEISISLHEHSAGVRIDLSLSHAIPNEEDIPFDLWQGRTYTLSVEHLRALHASAARALKQLEGRAELAGPQAKTLQLQTTK